MSCCATPVYKGSVTVAQTTGSAVHNVQVMSQVLFNAVKLDNVQLSDLATGQPLTLKGPISITVDSVRPMSTDFVGNKILSSIGLAQWTGGSFITWDAQPTKQTSTQLDKLRSPLTITVYDGSGEIVDTSSFAQPHIGISFSLYDSHVDLSSQN